MNIKRLFTLFACIFLTASCGCNVPHGACWNSELSEEETTTRTRYVNEEDLIVLQNPYSRTMINCYSNEQSSADSCAQVFEKRGYVRLRNVPQKPAKYDHLKGNTYPTRRWREGETTSRW